MAWLCIFFLAWSLALATPSISAAEVFYQNPVVAGDHPDPSIIRVGKDYWATSTSGEWAPIFPLLHSTDLVNWQHVSDVFSRRPAWAVGNFWAPEISEFHGRYYVYYSARQHAGSLAVAVAVADQPAGPYTDYGPLVAQAAGSIDPAPCTDEKGRPYLIWKEDGNSINQPTPIWAQPLDDSRTKLIGEPKELIRNDADWEGALVEGPYVLRRGQWFYLFYSGNGCCGPGCNYAVGVARSHSLPGPWQKNPANPILAANADWKCPGHGSIVSDEQGRYWLLYHAYPAHSSAPTGREAMLDEVVFETNDWPIINHGHGPSAQARSPFDAAQRIGEADFYDDFAGDHLQLGWQWPQQNEPAFHLQNHHLLLSAGSRHGTNVFAATLDRPTTTADYVATTVLEAVDLPPGALAGLAAFSDANNALGLSVGDGQLILWRRDHDQTMPLVQMAAPLAEQLYLRLTAHAGAPFQFAASANGQNWLPVGNNSPNQPAPLWERSVRLALTVGGKEDAEAKFASFRITPVTMR